MTCNADNVYDAILIPGGGIQPTGEPTPWVRTRLDQAIDCVNHNSASFVITLSGGSAHKPPPVDTKGYPIFESVANAAYLMKRGISAEQILFETSSYDTIGNAYFSRQIHIDPMRLRRLLVITSRFHMSRTRAIFEWVYGIEPRQHYMLSFFTVPDSGMDEAVLTARQSREQDSLRQLRSVAPKVKTLCALHEWLFSVHSAYTIAANAEGTAQLDDIVLQSY